MNKTIKALAALCASAMLLSTSALAANKPAVSDVTALTGFSVGFNEDNKLTVTAPDDAIPTEQMTLLVVDAAADPTAIAESDIIYINQQAVSEGDFENVGMLSTWLTKDDAAGKTYDVKLGYYWDADGDETPDFAIATALVTVSADGEPKTVTVLWGDVDCDGYADTVDATRILDANAGGTKAFPTSEYKDGYKYTWNTKTVLGEDGKTYAIDVLWGDVDCDGYADTVDATRILDANAGGTKAFPTDDPVYTWNTNATITLTEVVGQ